MPTALILPPSCIFSLFPPPHSCTFKMKAESNHNRETSPNLASSISVAFISIVAHRERGTNHQIIYHIDPRTFPIFSPTKIPPTKPSYNPTCTPQCKIHEVLFYYCSHRDTAYTLQYYLHTLCSNQYSCHLSPLLLYTKVAITSYTLRTLSIELISDCL